jgi:putative peptide zinc metalloprotease protein
VNRNPKLRGGLVIRKVAEGDDVAYTVCDSPRDKYFRIDLYTYLVATHLDGRRPLAEVSRLCQEAMPHNDLSLPVVEEAVQDLNAIGLLEDPYSKNLILIERARTRRPKIADFFRNMLHWEIGIWDPDVFLNRTIDRMRWLFHPALAAAVALGLLWSLWLVFVNRNSVSFDPIHLLVGGGGDAAQGILFLIVVLTVVGAVHEFGHAYACKHFGGEVHRMGAMLMYFGPCFFVDVSHSMLIENRWHRIWVAMGGIYFESFITVAAAALWWMTSPELAINDFAYRVMMMGLILGVVMNLNPLLKFDGYFVLSDLLQIGELREKSLRYVRDLLRRSFRKSGIPEERVVGARRRRAYITYGLLTLAYTYTVIVCFFQWLKGTLVGAWSEMGFVLFAGMLGLFVRKPVWRVLKHATAAARRPTRAMLPWAAAILVLAVAAHFIRLPGYVAAKARYVSSVREAIRAEGPGRVAAVFVREGDRVFPGRVVAILENDSLLAAWQGARSRSGQSSIDLVRSLEGSNPARYQNAALEQGAALADEASLRATRARLALAAREGGVVVTPHTTDLLGARLEAGDTLLVVARDARSEVECDLKEFDLGEIEPGQRFTLRLRGDPGRRLTGQVERVFSLPPETPGAKSRFKVWGRLDHANEGIRLGESGIARIEVGRWNLYERMGRAWARFVRADIWL